MIKQSTLVDKPSEVVPTNSKSFKSISPDHKRALRKAQKGLGRRVADRGIEVKGGKPMPKRDKLEAMLTRITDDEFNAIWKDTYGCLPEGDRSELARDFVAEQYDRELDTCIAVAESFLTPTRKPKPNKWLNPR